MAKIDLSERPRRRGELAAWYSRALAEQASSGLSVAEYAAGLGVRPTTLYQWKRRLSSKPAAVLRRVKRVEPAGLIQVALAGPLDAPDAQPFVLRLPGERAVEVPSRFDDESLRRLLGVLQGC